LKRLKQEVKKIRDIPINVRISVQCVHISYTTETQTTDSRVDIKNRKNGSFINNTVSTDWTQWLFSGKLYERIAFG